MLVLQACCTALHVAMPFRLLRRAPTLYAPTQEPEVEVTNLSSTAECQEGPVCLHFLRGILEGLKERESRTEAQLGGGGAYL